MKIRLMALAAVLCTAALAQAQNIPVTGAPGATLGELVNSPTMVTIVLKDSGARDPNLRIVEVHDTYIAILTEDGERSAYPVDSIAEIRVQGDKVERAQIELGATRALRGDEQNVVNRANARAAEVFAGATDQQARRIRAAGLLLMSNNREARTYLDQLLETNDIGVQLDAATALYLAGEPVPESIIRAGMATSSLRNRGRAIELAGLTNTRSLIPSITPLASDRAAEISAPAVRSLARMEVRDIVPTLLGMLNDTNERKSEAAIWSLVQLGGDDIVEQLKVRLPNAQGMARFRVLRVLHGLGDPAGRRHLSEIVQDTPTLAFEAALILARKGDWDASEVLRQRLQRRDSTAERVQVERARAAAALIAGGDPGGVSIFQDLLRGDSTLVRTSIVQMIAEIGERRMLTVIQPVLESSDAGVALETATTALSLGMPDFRDRLTAYRAEPPYLSR